MKRTQTLTETQNQLFASIRSLAEHTVHHTNSACPNSEKDILVNAQRNFSKVLRNYAEALVYDAYSRYDPYDGGEFLTHEAYQKILKSIEDDEVIPMEDIAEELGIKW